MKYKVENTPKNFCFTLRYNSTERESKEFICIKLKLSNFSYTLRAIKDRIFDIKVLLLFVWFLSTVHFKGVSPTDDTIFSAFVPLLKCSLEPNFCDGAQYPYRIFLNLIYGFGKTSFQSGFNIWKQENVCWG
jgi:hypothetical protein